ncbi:MAG: hypothetical protein AAB320_05280 [Elusimicrobiota bacterium]
MSADGKDAEPRVPRWAALSCLAVMLTLALALWLDVIGPAPKRDDIPPLSPAYWDPATVRKVRKEMTFDGAPCQSCHEGSEPMQGNPKEKGVFHEGIKLQHGRNQHCFNCHHRLQPADFSNFDGAVIKLADIELLCSRCHGTIYRDWKLGSHGRRSGAWDKAQGGPKSEVCIACHDPHWPVFKPLEAAPAPHVNPRGGPH